MKPSFLNIFLFSSVLILSAISSESDVYYNHTSLDTNLYFVFTTYRHGARYTFSGTDYFGNPVPNRGALTTYGGIQHLEIGKRYRERYSNFLNMSFDPKQMYVRSSDVERTVISTLKELEGLFGRPIERKNIYIVPNGLNFWELYQLNRTERLEREKYFGFCRNNKKRRLPSMNDVFPILQECYGATKAPDVGGFCDSVYTAYFQYVYSNETTNKIGKCGREKADKMHEFCVATFDTFRGWDEGGAYMFYSLYQNIFRYMFDAVEGRSELKMIMIGGHDITVDKFMNFLDGLRIIPRTHYPHYACNIVIELRKYSDEFYLEFYYNDILKYNETLQYFMDTLDNSKYSNLYNYCGLPPWAIPNTTQVTTENIKEIEIPTTQKVEETKKEIIPTTPLIQETTKKQEVPTTANIVVEITQKEIIPTTHLVKETSQNVIIPTTHRVVETTQKEIIHTTHLIKETTQNVIIPTTHKVEETIKKVEIPSTHLVKDTINQEEIIHIKKKETEKIELTNAQEINNEENEEEPDENKEIENSFESINNETNATLTQELIQSNSTLYKVKEKLKKFFKQDNDLNLYIILLSIVITIAIIIFFVIFMRYIIKKRRKFTRLAEEQSKNKSNNQTNNISMD